MLAWLATPAILIALALTCANAATGTPVGKWLAEDINGRGVLDRVQTTLDMRGDGKAFGSGGCNSYSSAVTIRGESMKFGLTASTMRACPPAQMDQDNKFHSALKTVRSWRVDEARRKLLLLNAEGVAVLRFSRMD